MSTPPPMALIMRSEREACRTTAAALRRLGFAVTECGDEPHLYAQAIRVATLPEDSRPPLVIVTEPAQDILCDLAMLRAARWPTPVVLVGPDATAATAERLAAAYLPCEEPTPDALRLAIESARTAALRN